VTCGRNAVQSIKISGQTVTLAPLLNASPAIQIHAFTAMAALALGAVQLAAAKGTLPHRTLGWGWVVLMFVVAASSLFIHELRVWGSWSPIHLLSIYVLITLPLAVLAAHRHATQRHRRAMVGLFVGGLVIAGLFTFYPGRIMHTVIFGYSQNR
jgi:uncharacterized membrane protein